jgi:large subunit ribosomal protein L29
LLPTSCRSKHVLYGAKIKKSRVVTAVKANAFAEMTTEELNDKLKELKEELFNLRFQLAVGQLQNPLLVRECRRNIARVNTIMRLREIQAQAQ